MRFWLGDKFDWIIVKGVILVLIFNQVDLQPIKIDWFPSYSELKIALESYGFLFKLSSNTDSARSSKFLTFIPVFMHNSG